MFYEYALEPALISSWDRARFFLDAFGPWKGRFLANYPWRWKKAVVEGLTCPDVEKKRIVERLAQLEKRIFSSRTNSPYDGSRSWFENADAEHQRQPFRAIVTSQATGAPHVLDGAEIDDRNELWRVESGGMVVRDPAVLGKTLRLLLTASQRVLLIDPYFRADKDAKTQPLLAVVALVPTGAAVEVHYSETPPKVPNYALSMSLAKGKLPHLLPAGRTVTLHCWKERLGGQRLHNRYLVTEIGGVQFGDSVETGDAGQFDRLSILDEPSRAELWNHYVGSPPAFDAAGQPQPFLGIPKRGKR